MSEASPFQAMPKLLLVADRRENLLVTAAALRPLQAEIFTASSGEEALDLALRHPFALVLLDVQMPWMDGFETALRMQAHRALAGVPIIFLTAISEQEHHARRAAEIGAADFIFKPIYPEILRSKVALYLDMYRQREQILRLNATLSQSNAELERFAYICSHDLQEPVRMMNFYAGLLAERAELLPDAQARRGLSFILDNAQRMQKMIRDILTFSRVGREALTFETVDCAAILREILQEFEDVIRQKAATVTCDPLPVLTSSATLMRILLQNLIGNALKFQDGTRPPAVHVAALAEPECWRFSVADNGIGVEDGFRRKIFTIFQRYHRNEAFPGTGIGLSTCRKFLQLYGGTIDFTSVPAKGSTFYFTLPRKEDMTDAAA